MSWYSLFIPVEDSARIAATLRDALTAADYRPYDPFPGGTGLSFGWKRQIKHFVAPPMDGWTRVLGEPDAAVLSTVAAAAGAPVIQAWLAAGDGGITVYTAAGAVDGPEGLTDFLKSGLSPADLERAWAGHMPVPTLQAEGPQLMAVPIPPEMAEMAEQVDPKQAEKMMNRLTKRMFKQAGGQGKAAQSDAQAMLAGPEAAWNTPAGMRLRAVMQCLTVPENWRTPEHAAVREAYQVARSRQHQPDGLRLPGDDESLARVPDALTYGLVYAGQR